MTDFNEEFRLRSAKRAEKTKQAASDKLRLAIHNAVGDRIILLRYTDSTNVTLYCHTHGARRTTASKAGRYATYCPHCERELRETSRIEKELLEHGRVTP